MLRIPVEENARLYAVARSILMDDEEQYAPSSNPDFEKRRRQIRENHDKKIEEVLQKISQKEWEEVKSDKARDNARNAFSDAILCDQDNNLLYFEMGMRCGYILFTDLTDTEGTIIEQPEPDTTEPPKIEDILQKDPATLTHEEITIINGATDIPAVWDYYMLIPEERRKEYRFIERMSKFFDVTYENGKITEFREKPSKLGDFSHLPPEEIRRLKISRNYLGLQRHVMQDWCRENGVRYIKAED